MKKIKYSPTDHRAVKVPRPAPWPAPQCPLYWDEYEVFDTNPLSDIKWWDLIIIIPLLLVCGFIFGLWYIITQT